MISRLISRLITRRKRTSRLSHHVAEELEECEVALGGGVPRLRMRLRRVTLKERQRGSHVAHGEAVGAEEADERAEGAAEEGWREAGECAEEWLEELCAARAHLTVVRGEEQRLAQLREQVEKLWVVQLWVVQLWVVQLWVVQLWRGRLREELW